MRLGKVMLVALLAVIASGANAQQGFDKYGYPLYDSVAAQVVRYYKTGDLDASHRYRLAKKPDGWYVCVQEYNVTPNAYTRFRICWNKASGSYTQPTDVENSAEDYEATMAQLKDGSYTPNNFIVNLYYGYRGWTEDVFHALEGKNKLNDEELQALARAYCQEAFYRLGHWFDYNVTEKAFELEEKPNSMTPSQLDTFKYYHGKGLSTYYKLWKQNPNYENFIGNVYTKYSGEVMSLFTMLMQYQNMDEAMKVLRDGLFDPFMLNFAKNMLASCPPNAILFTYGDNDTYPLYYVQANYGFRKDVLVVNHTLLATSRYINAVRRGLLNDAGFPMKMKTEEYSGNKLEYLSVTDADAKKRLAATGLEFDLKTDYLFKNDIAVLDMLVKNKWKRPVCFTITSSPDCLLGLHKYVQLRGMVYELKKEKQDKECADVYTSKTDGVFGYGYLMQTMLHTEWEKLPFRDENVLRISTTYQGIFSRTAGALITIGDTKKAYEVIEKCLQVIPDKEIPYGVFLVNVPGMMVQCGYVESGNKLAEVLVANSIKQFDEYIVRTKEGDCADCSLRLREAIYLLQEMVTYAKDNYADKELIAKMEKDFEEKKIAYYGTIK